MKIAVKDLLPNPFRNMNAYPIDKEKIDHLANSIEEKTFWDNILCRPCKEQNGKFEITYGHHRLLALQRNGHKQVDIPVRDLSDSEMIQIMAEENHDSYRSNPNISIETILVAKEFLDNEIKKYKDFDEFKKGSENSHFLSDAGNFERAKKDGVGIDTLQKFLGKNWTEWQVRQALQLIKDIKEERISKEAIQQFDKLKPAEYFTNAVKKHNIPLKSQVRIAKKIRKENIGQRDIGKTIEEEFPDYTSKKKEIKLPKNLPDVNDFTAKLSGEIDIVNKKLKEVIPYLDQTKDYIKEGLINSLDRLQKTIRRINHEEEN